MLDAPPDPIVAKLALEVAVDQLTRSGKEDRPDGAGKAETLSLLEVAEDAVGTTDGAPRRSQPAGGSRSPGRLAAIGVLVEIDQTVGRPASARDGSRAARVRAWAATMHGADLEWLTWAAATAERWVDACRGLVEGPRTLPVRGVACPTCGHARVTVLGGEGEDVVAPAITVDLRIGVVHCAACEGQWSVEAYAGLAAHLERQTSAEHLGG